MPASRLPAACCLLPAADVLFYASLLFAFLVSYGRHTTKLESDAASARGCRRSEEGAAEEGRVQEERCRRSEEEAAEGERERRRKSGQLCMAQIAGCWC
eukprot:1781393-Rhodomonas_salina.2